MNSIAEFAVSIGADITGFQRGLDAVEARMRTAGSMMQSAGAQIAAFMAPAAAGLFFAANAAVGFDTAMTNVGAVLGRSATEMAGLRAEILEMGTNSIQGPQAVAEAFYDIVGGVQDTTAHMAILQVAIDVATAGAAELGGTTAGLISIFNSYGLAAEDAARAGDVLTRTVGMGVGTMDEFAAAMPPVAGVAASMGIEIEQLGAQMAYLTTKGYSASESATLLSEMMSQMMAPTEAMKDVIHELGYESGLAMVEAEGLSGAYALISEHSGLAGVVTNFTALKGATALANEEAEAFFATFAEGVPGATQVAKDLQMEGAGAQFALLKSQMEGLAIQVGVMLLPALISITQAALPLIEQLSAWAAQNPDLAGGILAVTVGAVALGPVLMGLGGAILFLTSPIGLVVGALTALGLAYTTNFLGFRDLVDWSVNDIKTTLGELQAAFAADGIAGAWDVVKTKWTEKMAGIEAWVTETVIAPIGAAFSDPANWESAGQWLGQALQQGMLALGDLVMWASTNIVAPIFAGINAAFFSGEKPDLMGAIVGPMEEAASNPETWAGVQQNLTAFFSGFLDGLGVDPASVSAQGFINSVLVNPIKSALGVAETAVYNAVAAMINNAIPDSFSFELPVVNTPLGAIGGGSVDFSIPDPLGYRAMGGPVLAGMPYMVGERGPELFMPSRSGSIIPNNRVGSGGDGGRAVNISGPIHVYGVQDVEGLLDQLETEARRRGQ